ncbi:MAG: hypothetical protein ACLUOF_07705 [Ruminococcus sp.]
MHLFRLDVQNNAKFLVHRFSAACMAASSAAAAGDRCAVPFLLLIKGVHHLHHFLVIVTVQDILKDATPFPAVAAFCSLKSTSAISSISRRSVPW